MSGGGAAHIQCPSIDGFTFIVDANGVCVGSPNWAEVFTQVGRVDFITILLATVAILLVFLAFPAYQIIRMRCERIAKEIGDQVRAEAQVLALDEVQKTLPGLVEDFMDLNRGTTDEQADQIAQAQEDGQNV